MGAGIPHAIRHWIWIGIRSRAVSTSVFRQVTIDTVEYSGNACVHRLYNGYFMPCLILLIGLAFPRVALVILFFFSTFLERAYHSLLLVALGFVFLPLTTIVYAWIVNGRHPLDGIYLVALILAVLADLGLIGHGEYRRRRAD